MIIYAMFNPINLENRLANMTQVLLSVIQALNIPARCHFLRR